MNKNKEVLIAGFALFSMFFGAGNLILPPFLGKEAGASWLIVTLGFFITAVFIPILGIYAYAKIQGTMYDFAAKVSPLFSTIYCLSIYAISVTLPGPRTASVVHEMTIQPYFPISSLATSSIYFSLVFLFVINRAKIVALLGKFLTPLIILILVCVILIGVFTDTEGIAIGFFENPFTKGVLEGYQTFDAIGAVVIGGVLVISMNYTKENSFQEKKMLITKAGFIAGAGLLLIYAGLIYNGAAFKTTFTENATRAEILNTLSRATLGKVGTKILSLLVALACFTTAVGIVTGTADYFKGMFQNSKKAYLTTAFIACILGVVIGQFDVNYIINIAFPILIFIYPITIVLILLNSLPEKLATPMVFKAVVLTAFIFSIPDFLQYAFPNEKFNKTLSLLPLSTYHLSWVLPSVLVFSMVITFRKIRIN